MEETRSSTLSPSQPLTASSTRGENWYEVQWLELYLIKKISSFQRDLFHKKNLIGQVSSRVTTADLYGHRGL